MQRKLASDSVALCAVGGRWGPAGRVVDGGGTDGGGAQPEEWRPELGMVIWVWVQVTHGFQTQRVRSWVQFCNCMLHPHPTHTETGLGTGLVLHPRVTRRVFKKSQQYFSPVTLAA
jgi:hypothetical protein